MGNLEIAINILKGNKKAHSRQQAMSFFIVLGMFFRYYLRTTNKILANICLEKYTYFM